jgi:hypothetical protein
MPDKSGPPRNPDLRAAVERSLPRLRALSLFLDTYGTAENAATLREVVNQLGDALPEVAEEPNSIDFVVNATFKVSRRQVAYLLSNAFEGGSNYWCRIGEFTAPKHFRFRVAETGVLPNLDYPLNEGGSLEITIKENATEIFRLKLDSIARGLTIMASKYPRHFADFLNDNADGITADVFLQCCLFGGLIYG